MSQYKFFSLMLAMCMVGSLGCLIVDDGRDHDDDDYDENNISDDDDRRDDTPTDDPKDDPQDDPKDDPNDDPTAAFIIKGQVAIDEGMTPPESGNVLVLWTVSATSPDYVVAYGRGQYSGDSFSVGFKGELPPEEALNYGSLGVAMILAFPEDVALPEAGKLDRATYRDLTSKAIGITRQHGVIYKTTESDAANWIGNFESNAYMCGQGTEQANSSFEGFAPISCADVTLNMTTVLDWVNWT